jgi:hypothetical protein
LEITDTMNNNITQMRQRIARETGVPTSKAGAERKIGNIILKALFKKR